LSASADEREAFGVALLEAGLRRAKKSELAEDALDEIAEALEAGAERGEIDPTGRGSDVASCALAWESRANGVAAAMRRRRRTSATSRAPWDGSNKARL
jgi:hypothetical protein